MDPEGNDLPNKLHKLDASDRTSGSERRPTIGEESAAETVDTATPSINTVDLLTQKRKEEAAASVEYRRARKAAIAAMEAEASLEAARSKDEEEKQARKEASRKRMAEAKARAQAKRDAATEVENKKLQENEEEATPPPPAAVASDEASFISEKAKVEAMLAADDSESDAGSNMASSRAATVLSTEQQEEEEERLEAELLEEERKRAAEEAKEKARLDRESVAAKSSEMAAIRMEVETLVKETNSSKNVDELLEEYDGREDELLANLRNLKEEKDAEEEEQKERAATAAATGMAVGLDALETTGRDDAASGDASSVVSDMSGMSKMERVRAKMANAQAERAEYMTFMKSQEARRETESDKDEKRIVDEKAVAESEAEEGHQAVVRANIAALMDEYEIPKDKADQMYSEYEGKEEELLSFLKKMGEEKRIAAIAAAAAEAESKDEEADEGHKAVVRANIDALIDEHGIPKNKADEMLAKYMGKEEELLSFLKQMGQDNRAAAIAAAAAEAEAERKQAEIKRLEAEVERKRQEEEAEKLRLEEEAERQKLEKEAERKRREEEEEEAEKKKTLAAAAVVGAGAAALVASSPSRSPPPSPTKPKNELQARFEARRQRETEAEAERKRLEEERVTQVEDSPSDVAQEEELEVQEDTALVATTKASIIAEIKSLSAEHNIPMDKADEMLNRYEGREDELLLFLRKMSEGDMKKVADASQRDVRNVAAAGAVIGAGAEAAVAAEDKSVDEAPQSREMDLEPSNDEPLPTTDTNLASGYLFTSDDIESGLNQEIDMTDDNDNTKEELSDIDEPEPDNEQPVPWWKNRRNIALMACIMIVLIIAIAVGVSVGGGSKKSMDPAESEEVVDPIVPAETTSVPSMRPSLPATLTTTESPTISSLNNITNPTNIPRPPIALEPTEPPVTYEPTLPPVTLEPTDIPTSLSPTVAVTEAQTSSPTSDGITSEAPTPSTTIVGQTPSPIAVGGVTTSPTTVAIDGTPVPTPIAADGTPAPIMSAVTPNPTTSMDLPTTGSPIAAPLPTTNSPTAVPTTASPSVSPSYAPTVNCESLMRKKECLRPRKQPCVWDKDTMTCGFAELV